jgi:hypothetical protein
VPEGEATKPRRSVFKNIVHTLNRVYVIDLIFQAHLEGREHDFTARNTADHPPRDELRRKLRDFDAGQPSLALGFVDRLKTQA